MHGTRVAAALVVLAAAGTATAAAYRIDPEGTVLAIVTHKTGIAASLAHDHLVVAGEYDATLELDPDDLTATRFEATVPVAALVVDRHDLHERWYPRLHDLGIQDAPFPDVSDKDRAKIRKSMLSERQLDAEAHPEIHAAVLRIARRSERDDPAAMPFVVTLALEVRGVRVERDVDASCRVEGGRVEVEARGSFRFTEFGIEPFSALLGAIRNADAFDVYVHLAAAEVSGR